MKTNDNKSVKPQHLAAVALATAVTLPGMAILAEEVDQKLIEQDVIQQTENSEFVGITDTIFYEEENIGEEVPDTNQFNESQEKESDEEKLFLGESEEFTTENQENENLKDSGFSINGASLKPLKIQVVECHKKNNLNSRMRRNEKWQSNMTKNLRNR
ncbi:hypothetical protein [Dubosiella newyorkensis]